MIISLSILLRMGNVSDKVVEKIRTFIICSMTFFPENLAVYETMWKNTVQPDRSKTTVWRMRVACF